LRNEANFQNMVACKVCQRSAHGIDLLHCAYHFVIR
jgi:hypothetical protein